MEFIFANSYAEKAQIRALRQKNTQQTAFQKRDLCAVLEYLCTDWERFKLEIAIDISKFPKPGILPFLSFKNTFILVHGLMAEGQCPDLARDASGFTWSSEPTVLYLNCIKTVSALFNTKGDTDNKQTGYIQMKFALLKNYFLNTQKQNTFAKQKNNIIMRSTRGMVGGQIVFQFIN